MKQRKLKKNTTTTTNNSEVTEKNFKDFPETDEKGNVKHIFAQFTTSWVNEDNKNLAEPAKADEFKKEEQFEGYKLIDTKEEGRTKVYTKVETEIPNDSPTVEVPELKITRFIDINGNDIHELVKEFVNKLDINGYDFVETQETSDIRTHIYKKHVNEEVPSDNTTTPTDSSTPTENKVIVEHTAPTGDNMSSTLKLFALSVLGLGFVLLYRKKITG